MIAAPVRELLKSVVRQRIRTESDKRELARFLNRSISFVNQLIYYGEGGMDAWIGALSFTYQIDSAKLAEHLKDFSGLLRKLSPLCEADKAWFELDKKITPAAKLHWMSVIQSTLDAEQGKKPLGQTSVKPGDGEALRGDGRADGNAWHITNS